MYEKPACGDYQAQFRMVNNKGLDTVVAVDSFLNNQNTYQLSSDRKKLMRPQAGGYRLRFDIPQGSTMGDSLRICIDAYKMSYRCVGCAAAGSDAIFGPTDIDLFCPYNNAVGNDLIACYRRDSREGNWEAWITDPRDCQPYRIILMPDNKWWFARNLTFTKDLTNSGNADKGQNGENAANNATLFGNYWCPGGLTITSGAPQTNRYDADPATNQTAATGGMAACRTYGALYTWYTAMRLDGRGSEQPSVKAGVTSTAQGICPNGWLLPSDYDWGVMLNAAEGCPDPEVRLTPPPCNHLFNDNSTRGKFGLNAATNLKSTLSAPPHSHLVDTTFATISIPAWPWRRADYAGKIAASAILGNDKYGFGLLPAGYRRYDNFSNLGNSAFFWSSTESALSDRILYRGFEYADGRVARLEETSIPYKWAGFSVRCVKEALPATAVIVAPATISYLSGELPVSFKRSEGSWTYTWSVHSTTISNVEKKVTFDVNGTAAAHTAKAKLAFDQADVDKSFTIKLVVSNGSISRTITKDVKVVSLSIMISINHNSVGGMITATAVTTGNVKYTYAWGDGSQNFTPDNTNMQPINTAAGTKAQTKTWYLKVKDTRNGIVSEQISQSYTFPDIPANTTFCSSCGNDGTQNVDAWLATMIDTGYLTTDNAYGLANATDINNGRQNSQRLHKAGVGGMGLYGCLKKGSGWYVPAAEEYCRIKAANLHTKAVSNTSGTWLSTIQAESGKAMGISCWNANEPSGNGPGIAVWANYLLDDFGATNAGTRHIVCIWRPDD
ncbi:MAG: hypothetical protein LBH84_01650 [Prevotellaceae bacterium]|nr:hypothetical protein [Prevotellaceae bacterium]